MSVTCDRSVDFSGSSNFHHTWKWPPRYNWNIVESGVKHHQTNNNVHYNGIVLLWKMFTDTKMKRTQTMVDKARHRTLWIEQHDPHQNRNTEVIRKTVPHNCKKKHIWGRRGRDRMVVGFTITYSISAYHHLFVRSNPAHGDVYSIQHYVIQFVRNLRQIGGFLLVLRFPPPIKLKYWWKWR